MHALLQTLLWTQLWQVTLLAVVVWILVRLFTCDRPHLAHLLWLLVLVKCLTPPVWSSSLGVFCWLDTADAGDDRHVSPEDALSEQRFDTVAFVDTPPIIGALADEEFTPNLSPPPSNPLPVQFEPPDAAEEYTSITADQPATADEHNAPTTDFQLQTLFIVLWIGIGSIVFAMAVLRYGALRMRIALRRRRLPADLIESLSRVAETLGLRRRRRLVVTSLACGPAVVGLFRPLIVLPDALLNRCSPRTLQIVIAHELLHIRRGDVCIGGLQLLARALWWFHPLIWLASRRTTQQAERCCDEAVIALLKCTPAEYARGLLEVLELKRSYNQVPIFPGMRPVDITSNRLERIMDLNQNCRQRTPWWCWLVMLCAAAVALPGAQLAASGDADDQSNPQQERETSAASTSAGMTASDPDDKLQGNTNRVSSNGGDNPNALAQPVHQQYAPSAKSASNLTIRTTSSGDSVELRTDGRTVLIRTERNDQGLSLEYTPNDGVQILAQAATIRIVQRDNKTKLAFGGRRLLFDRPIEIEANQVRLATVDKIAEVNDHLKLIAQGDVRMSFHDAKVRCTKATLVMRTTPQKTHEAELLLEGEVVLTRALKSEQMLLRGERASISLHSNKIRLDFGNVQMRTTSEPLGAGDKKLGTDDTSNGDSLDRVVIHRAMGDGTSSNEFMPPTEQEILKALRGKTENEFETLKGVRIQIQKIADYVDQPKTYPLLGRARAQHAHYKCTIFYDENTREELPNPATRKNEKQYTFIADVTRLHPLAMEETSEVR